MAALGGSLPLGTPRSRPAHLVNKLLASSDVGTRAALADTRTLDADLLSAAPPPEPVSHSTAHQRSTRRVELVRKHWSRHSTPVRFVSLGRAQDALLEFPFVIT